MPELADIRAALAANLATLTDVQVSPYMLASPTPPCIEIYPDEVSYDQALQRGLDQWTLIVRAYVGLTTDQGAQIKLDELLAPSGAMSVKAAVESDPDLGGSIDDLRVTRASGYRIYARPGTGELLGCEWTVDIYAVGN
jgi:hypothetical protein